MSRQKPTHRGIITNKKLCGEGNISRVGIINGNDSEWLNSGGHEALVYAVFHRIRLNKFYNNVTLPFILRIHDVSLERKHCSEFSETLKEITYTWDEGL